MKEIITLKPEIWDIDKLIPYENNSKIHKPEQIARLAESIKDQGLEQYPHVQPDGVIITGHGRALALKSLGYKKVPVYVRDDLDEMGWRKLRLASNKSVSNEYDVRLEKIEVNEMLALLGDDVDLTMLALQTGFSARDLEIFTEDLGASIIDFDDIDLSQDVKPESAADEEKVIEKGVALSKLFGFTTLATSDARVVKRWLSGVKASASKDSTLAEAFVEFVNKQMEQLDD